jgi:hypothetical protein
MIKENLTAGCSPECSEYGEMHEKIQEIIRDVDD